MSRLEQASHSVVVEARILNSLFIYTLMSAIYNCNLLRFVYGTSFNHSQTEIRVCVGEIIYQN